MKKLFVLMIAAVGGYVAYRRWQEAQAEEDLWIEATSAEPAPTSVGD